MHKFYFSKDLEGFSNIKKPKYVLVKTYKSLIDLMNSYHYYRLNGSSIDEALKQAV